MNGTACVFMHNDPVRVGDGAESAQDRDPEDGDGFETSPLVGMLERLRLGTNNDFAAHQSRYRTFMSGVELAVQESDFYGALVDLERSLAAEFVVGKIRAIDSWANGESSFKLDLKSWESLIDKLLRINIEDNRLFKQDKRPPFVMTVTERAQGASEPAKQRWITPDLAHEVADDLIRTKFVVPFADGVVDISERITQIMDGCGLPRYTKFHAKDSGYHARHHYVLLSVPGYDGGDTRVAFEIKVLTKMQDTLGELTHMLYERQRTGLVPVESKSRLAWLFEEPDFLASYIGHAGHFIEASMVGLKDSVNGLEAKDG